MPSRPYELVNHDPKKKGGGVQKRDINGHVKTMSAWTLGLKKKRGDEHAIFRTSNQKNNSRAFFKKNSLSPFYILVDMFDYM